MTGNPRYLFAFNSQSATLLHLKQFFDARSYVNTKNTRSTISTANCNQALPNFKNIIG